MAVKAIGKLRMDQTSFEVGAEVNIHIDIDARSTDNGYAADVDAGTYDASLPAATINAMLAAFVKSYATIQMGVTFDLGDTAVMLDGLSMTTSAV